MAVFMKEFLYLCLCSTYIVICAGMLSQFHGLVLRKALCFAKCYTLGSTKFKEGSLSDFSRICETPTCEICLKIVLSKTDDICRIMQKFYCNADLDCKPGCECLDKYSDVNELEALENEDQGHLVAPRLHCQIYKSQEMLSKAYLIHDYTPVLSYQDIPVMFVIDRRTNGTDWDFSFTVSTELVYLDDLMQGEIYQWRITAVSEDKILKGPVFSHWIQMPKWTGDVQPVTEAGVRQLDFNPYTRKIDAVIYWSPTADMSCFYQIFVLNNKNGRFDVYESTQTDLYLRKQLSLDVDSDYFVDIFSKLNRVEEHKESVKYRFRITTPSCLEATAYSFHHCAPPGVQNLTNIVTSQGDNTIMQITWEPPINTTELNVIDEYIVDVFKSIEGGDYLQNSSISLKGVQTFLSIMIGEDVGEYVVFVTPVANKRNGTRASLRVCIGCEENFYDVMLNINHGPTLDDDTTPTSYNVQIVTYSTLGIFVFLCVSATVYGCFRKRQRDEHIKRERNISDHSVQDSPLLSNEEPRDEFEIDMNDLKMGEMIGQGAFGRVYKAELLQRKGKTACDWLVVAVKLLKMSATEDDKDTLLQEIRVLKSIGSHPNIVNIIGACTRSPNICLIVEFSYLGDLLTYLRKVRQTKLEEEADYVPPYISGEPQLNYAILDHGDDSSVDDAHIEGYLRMVNNSLYQVTQDPPDAPKQNSMDDLYHPEPQDLLSMARQIALGMEYLMNNKVVHRDLAARNVLIFEDRIVKVSDFGLSRDVYEENFYKKTTSGKLPIKWMALESLFHQIYTSKSDIWSFGIVLWEIVTLGAIPYPSLNGEDVLMFLKRGGRLFRPDNCDDDLYNIMCSCWHVSPVSRPNFTEVRIKMDKLLEKSIPHQYMSLDVHLMPPDEECDLEEANMASSQNAVSHQLPSQFGTLSKSCLDNSASLCYQFCQSVPDYKRCYSEPHSLSSKMSLVHEIPFSRYVQVRPTH